MHDGHQPVDVHHRILEVLRCLVLASQTIVHLQPLSSSGNSGRRSRSTTLRAISRVMRNTSQKVCAENTSAFMKSAYERPCPLRWPRSRVMRRRESSSRKRRDIAAERAQSIPLSQQLWKETNVTRSRVSTLETPLLDMVPAIFVNAVTITERCVVVAGGCKNEILRGHGGWRLEWRFCKVKIFFSRCAGCQPGNRSGDVKDTF